MKKKIGLMGASLLEWGGGLDFLKNMIYALSYDPNAYEFYLFIPTPGNSFKSVLKRTIKQYVLRKEPFTGLSEERIQSVLQEFPNIHPVYFENSSDDLKKAVLESGISLLFPCCYSLGSHFPIPWIGHIPDFQHLHYPEYFSKEEINNRNQLDETLLKESKSMLMLSESAVKDSKQFFRDYQNDFFIVPFSPVPRKEWLEEPDSNTLERYGFPGNLRYFMISNQFWVHKNHICAFKALSILHKNPEYQDVHLICTGSKTDWRNEDYMNRISTEIDSLGLNEYIHLLGYIPKKDQINLMRKSIAVIQPTRFEGSPGGLEIYDAVAIGQQSIVSDIEVNRELNEDSVLYFKSDSEKDLAEQMENSINRNWIVLNDDELMERGKLRQERYFNLLHEMIERSI